MLLKTEFHPLSTRNCWQVANIWQFTVETLFNFNGYTFDNNVIIKTVILYYFRIVYVKNIFTRVVRARTSIHISCCVWILTNLWFYRGQQRTWKVLSLVPYRNFSNYFFSMSTKLIEINKMNEISIKIEICRTELLKTGIALWIIFILEHSKNRSSFKSIILSAAVLHECNNFMQIIPILSFCVQFKYPSNSK